MSEMKNTFPEMLTAEDLQNFGFTRSMAYAFLNREDVPVIRIGKRKFIRKEKFVEWLEEQERKNGGGDK
ncbi:MAG: helix-turn-helix domain-containing protein [Ruminococcus sp.]|nr:helix-turn-helix domain-containing protein [Ruminococcus sp.]MCM1382289.1 helix-turn-helix domain-containing protein [Muribaculaceae bacterium]